MKNSERDLIPYFFANKIRKLGRRPAESEVDESGVVCHTHKIKFRSVDVSFELTDNGMLRTRRLQNTLADGRYLHYSDQWTTIARINPLVPIVVSGNFSGCVYKLYNTDDGVLCAHVAREAGTDGNHNETLLSAYALQNGWAELISISTGPYLHKNGSTEILVVSQLRPTTVDTLVLGSDNNGNIVGIKSAPCDIR